MSYPRLESAPPPPPTQHEIDAATRRRTIDRFERVMARMLADIARGYERCGKAACVRSRRCRGTACELEADDGFA